MPLVKLLNRVICLHVITRRQVLTQENLLIFFQVEEILVFLDIFALSYRLLVHFGLLDWLPCVLSE